MEFEVDNTIVVKNPTETMRSWCNSRLVIDNPDYYKKEKMGKWTGGTPQSIYLYERKGTDYVVPFGCLTELWSMFKECHWDVHIRPLGQVSYSSSIKLYDYQETAVNKAVEKKNGILVMPCGSGKTQSGLEIIARLGGKALWLTHTQDLLNQSLSRAKSVFPNLNYGVISMGKVSIGTQITFATIQTMSKINLADYKDEWDIIIVDECQHCCGTPTRVTQFYKVVNSLSARYKFGLTATPKRADGLERSMFALIGDIIHEVKRSEVKSTTCPIKVRQLMTFWTPDYDCVLTGDGTIDYNKVIEQMISSQERFNYVFDTITQLKKEPKIVLANRVDYLQRLCDAYNNGGFGNAVCLSTLQNNKFGRAERKRALIALNDGDIDCLFATYQLAKEGLDVPNLRYIIFATPEKDETTIIQAAGRVGRKADGKEFGTVIDLIDEFGLYTGWSLKRQRWYRKIGADIL